MPIIIKNNLKTLALYLCIILATLPFFFGFGENYFWGEETVAFLGLENLIIKWAMIGIHTAVSVGLCFLLGRKGLTNAEVPIVNIFSVVSPIILTSVIVLVVSFPWGFWGWFVSPIVPMSLAISFFFQISLEAAFIIMSIILAFVMYLGMMSRKRKLLMFRRKE